MNMDANSIRSRSMAHVREMLPRARASARGVARHTLPQPVKRMMLRYTGDWHRTLLSQQPIVDAFVATHGAISAGGAFRGMRLAPDALEGNILPKLVGCYEEELGPILEARIAAGYDRVIDVGCASGWYVVGMARRLPNAEVYGFDLDAAALRRCRDLARLNGVQDRVHLRRRCRPADLQELIRGRTLVVVDIEGAELELLDPVAAPALRKADIIVEVHDILRSGVGDAMLPRFEATHDEQRVMSTKRDSSRYPVLQTLPPDQRDLAVDEFRPGQMWWAILTARGDSAQ